MACQAIKKDYTRCRCWAENGFTTCYQHRSIPPREKKKRWFNHYILARNKNAFPFLYASAQSHRGKLVDLESGEIVLTQEDVARIPPHARYSDIFSLLCARGYAEPSWNPQLRYRTIHHAITMFTFSTFSTTFQDYHNKAFENYILPMLGKEQQIFGAQSLFYKHILSWSLQFLGQPESVRHFLDVLMKLDGAKAESLTRFEEWLLPLYHNLLKNPKTNEIENPVLKELYATLESYLLGVLGGTRQTFKHSICTRMNLTKEELIVKTWHPDRFMEWCLDQEDKKDILDNFQA
jgi:hypothetical protein